MLTVEEFQAGRDQIDAIFMMASADEKPEVIYGFDGEWSRWGWQLVTVDDDYPFYIVYLGETLEQALTVAMEFEAKLASGDDGGDDDE